MSPLKSRLAVLAAMLYLAAACGGATAGRSAAPAGLTSIGAGLTGPAGSTATVYARGLANVAAFAFDPEGRLWAATADYAGAGHDALYLVAAAGATPIPVVADLHTPLGLLWYQGSLYVSSSGRVDAFSDFDGTAFRSRRSVVTFPDGTGELNALALSPAGRLMLGISAPCDHCAPTSPWSASIVSFLPDGSDLRVEASGIRAPVGLAYYPGTDDLFATMNQRDDLESRTPGDFLAVVHTGEAWHFPNCFGQGGVDCTGVPAPTAVLDRHAAAGDVAIVGSTAIVAEWALGKVLRVTLSRNGTQYRGTVETFLTGVKHPVAVAAGPDGGIYVGDWSGGTVYRVTGATGANPPA